MTQLVYIENLEDGKIKITIKRMPKTLNHYKIYFRECGGSKLFFENIIIENCVSSKSYEQRKKNGVGTVHIHLSKDDDNASYEIVLDNTNWVNKHIKDIIRQLLHQQEQILVNITLKRQVKAITHAVRSNSYTSLIKQMITDNADSFSSEDIKDIQQTLKQVEHSSSVKIDI